VVEELGVVAAEVLAQIIRLLMKAEAWRVPEGADSS